MTIQETVNTMSIKLIVELIEKTDKNNTLKFELLERQNAALRATVDELTQRLTAHEEQIAVERGRIMQRYAGVIEWLHAMEKGRQ